MSPDEIVGAILGIATYVLVWIAVFDLAELLTGRE